MSQALAVSHGLASTVRWRTRSPMNASGPEDGPDRQVAADEGRPGTPRPVPRGGSGREHAQRREAGRQHHRHDHHLPREQGCRQREPDRAAALDEGVVVEQARVTGRLWATTADQPGRRDRETATGSQVVRRARSRSVAIEVAMSSPAQTKSRLQPNGRVVVTRTSRPASRSSTAFARSWLVTRSAIRASSKRPWYRRCRA